MLKMDMISSFPDGIISHILSFLPLKMAAQTSVLSKKWRILFAFSPDLNLFDWKDDNRKSFMDFVNRVLAVSENSQIKKLTLTCSMGFDSACINRWICHVLNRGVMDLDLCVDANDGYSLPVEIFTCKTLVKLQLYGFWIDVVPEDAYLPALETLLLSSVRFYNLHVCAFQKLLSASPVLKDLVLCHLNWEQWQWSRVVSSPSLERLTMTRMDFYGFDGSDFGSITFDTPNVTHLDYYDFIPGSYPIVNLDSLVEANLDLVVTVHHTWDMDFADENDPITSNPTNLIKGLRNVQIMNLLAHESLEMFYFFRNAIPVFQNLVQLSIMTIGVPECCWRGLPCLVNNAPILETLNIKGTLHYNEFGRHSSVCECLSGHSFLLSCPLKVLKITEYNGTTGEVEQLKHFLGKLPCLELLKIKITGADEFQITKDLLMLPRASSKCKVKVK